MEIENDRGARSIKLTPGEVREIYDLRILLECDCLQRAAQVITPAQLKEIDSNQGRNERAQCGPHWAANDWAFHQALYRFAGRRRQLTLIEALRRTCLLFVSAYTSLPGKVTRWEGEHKLILRHLEKGETELAVALLRRHLEAAAQHLLDRMSQD